MLLKDPEPNTRKLCRRPATYVLLVLLTTGFLILYSVSLDTRKVIFLTIATQKYVFERKLLRNQLVQRPEKDFLVYSESCKIPDLDPFDPSVQNIIGYTKPVDCSQYEALTIREDSTVVILDEVATRKGITNFTCCSRAVLRDYDGLSDDKYRISDNCEKFGNGSSVYDEFIKVECSYENKTIFYTNFHSFVHNKPQVERRCKNSKAKYNFLLIGIDAVSRLNMHRQLNKTSHYLLHNMGAKEMYGFNKVGDNTFPNLIPLLTGFSVEELQDVCWNHPEDPLDECDFMWKHFQQVGYRTLYAEDTPHISSFNYVKEGFYHQPTDYYFRHFILAYENELGRDKPLNCYLCVGPVSETEAVLQWVEQFASHYDNKPYFAFAWINSLTHDNLNTGSSGDHIYEKFFRTLHTSGKLNNTIIILMGDHGMRWGRIRSTYIGRMEEMLPMLLFVLPPSFKEEHPVASFNLAQNAHRLVTPFDIYATLKHLLVFTDSSLGRINLTHSDNETWIDIYKKRSISLFRPIPENRSCQDAYIDESWCTCHLSAKVPTKGMKVKYVAKFILYSLNKLLHKHTNSCATLTLKTIIEASKWSSPNAGDKEVPETNIYTVGIETVPGNALFEGTVKYDISKRKHKLLGTISRLNMYKDQSICVHDAILKKYCYCKHI